MCDSLQPAVGYNWGAGKLSRVRAIEKCCFAASAVVSLLAAVALSCFPAQVASLFMAGSGQEVLVMASGALRLLACLLSLAILLGLRKELFRPNLQ